MTSFQPRRWLTPLIVLLLPAATTPAEQQNRGLHPVQSAAAQATDAASGSASEGLDPADAYRLELLKIKGHLGVARTLLRLGDPGAGEHLGGSITGIFDGIALQLNDRSAPLSRDTLAQLEAAVDVVQAEALVRHSSGIKGSPGHDALIAAVVLVRQAWPGIRPPPIVFDPQSVADRLEEAVVAMDRLR